MISNLYYVLEKWFDSARLRFGFVFNQIIRLCFVFLIKFIVIQDKNVTSSPHPYLTECFRDTALQWLPMGIFWLVLPLWLWMLHKRKIRPQPLPVSVLFVAKMVKICVYLYCYCVKESEESENLIRLVDVHFLRRSQ
jgi:hypothetical protein